MGLAASPDDGSISGVLQKLKSQAEQHLGPDRPIEGAILALPSVIALYEEDAYDALEHLGITNLIGTHLALCSPREINAAYVGYGYGICTHWLTETLALTRPSMDQCTMSSLSTILEIVFPRLESAQRPRSTANIPTVQRVYRFRCR